MTLTLYMSTCFPFHLQSHYQVAPPAYRAVSMGHTHASSMDENRSLGRVWCSLNLQVPTQCPSRHCSGFCDSRIDGLSYMSASTDLSQKKRMALLHISHRQRVPSIYGVASSCVGLRTRGCGTDESDRLCLLQKELPHVPVGTWKSSTNISVLS